MEGFATVAEGLARQGAAFFSDALKLMR